MTAYTIEQLEAVGGKVWKQNGMRRVYLNALPGWYGLDGEKGNWTLNGEHFSNNQADKLCARLAIHCAKFFYDLDAGTFRGDGLSDDEYAQIRLHVEQALAAKAEKE